jgi:hypothetical protein
MRLSELLPGELVRGATRIASLSADAATGRMSRDFTGGYGPEEFSLTRAKPGKYRIEADFFGHRQQVVASATTLQVKLTTRFGTNQAGGETDHAAAQRREGSCCGGGVRGEVEGACEAVIPQ